MNVKLDIKKINIRVLLSCLISLSLFWIVLGFKIPPSFTQYFHRYSLLTFLGVLAIYYLIFRLPGTSHAWAGLGITMLLVSLTLSYLWTSGFSDNFLIGGLLPYKDAKNYYMGANLLLNGLTIRNAFQAVERPLFPGFLSSLLLFTGQNLKICLAIIVQMAGIALYLTTSQIRDSLGQLTASVYITFMYFYLQLCVGYVMSELLGFIGGCFAFALLWYASRDLKWLDLLLGLMVLMVAISARAGAFFIFPTLALWAGFAYRGKKRFSLLSPIIVIGAVVVGYLISNVVYPRLVGVPDGSSFGNFSYALYGQVRGGIGWHSAIDELKTRNPSIVYQAALAIFLANPFDFIKAAIKSYTDFFLPGDMGIFAFGTNNKPSLSDYLIWGGTIVVLARGLIRLLIRHRSNVSAFLLAGFFGIIFSIPFLPPVDGGMRFYASTMPFFFVLVAVGTSRSVGQDENIQSLVSISKRFLPHFASILFLTFTIIMPIFTLRWSEKTVIDVPSCLPEQKPFIIKVNPGSYIDLMQSDNGVCGLAPKICFSDFLRNNTEIKRDDFYREIESLTSKSKENTRLIPAINQIDNILHYFFITDSKMLVSLSHNFISGCSVRIKTRNQYIFRIESINSISK